MFVGLFLGFLGVQAVDTYGKSESEVLSMGQGAWYKFYTSKAGDSTVAMTNAYGIYADIASARNDRLLADPKQPRRQTIMHLRKILLDFGSDMMSLGSEITGGGTMWNTLGAQEYADAQDTVYAVIHPGGQPVAKHRVVSDVLAAIAKYPTRLQKESEDGVVTKDQLKTAPQDIKAARAVYFSIAKVAATFDRATSDRILDYCWDQAQLPFSE